MLLRKTYVCGSWHLDRRVTKQMGGGTHERGESNYCCKAKFWCTCGEMREM